MENRKIILLVISVSFLSCKNPQYIHVKSDLYIKNDTIFLLQKNTWKEIDNEKTIINYEYNVIYKNKVLALKDIIHIDSYTKEEKYYYDKHNIYYHNSTPGFFPALNAIPSESKKLIQFHGDYVSTDNKIFFQSNEIKHVDYNTFKVANKIKNGYYYAYDKNYFYYKDSIITDKKILENIKKEIYF